MAEQFKGANWTLGEAGLNRFPDGAGGTFGWQTGAGTGAAGASYLRGAKCVQILGYTVTATTGAGKTISFGSHNGTTITGLTFPAEAVGTYLIGEDHDGVRYENNTSISTASNVCIKCQADVTAIMHWRKLK
jgi:hypothetical protein